MKALKTSALFFLAATALLFTCPAEAAVKERVELSFGTGPRLDNLDWNIAGITVEGNFVNVLSELTWSDIESQEFRLNGKVFLDRYLLRGEAGYGFITSGENQDSDFLGDDRTFEYSRSNNSSDDGSVWDVSGALGYVYDFPAFGGKMEIIPLAGLSYHRQDLVIKDGVQTIATPDLDTPPLGPFGGLYSTYKAGWGGPWAGVDLAYRAKSLRVFGTFEYHVSYYNAEANWNLRGDFAHPVSFEHWANGRGIVFSAGTEYNFSRSWSFVASFKASDFQADDGTDRTYFSNGSFADTPLNEVNWDSRSAFFGLNYRF